MNISLPILMIILGCTLVTLVPRIIPFIFVRSVKLPEVVVKWLSFVPVCIFTALVVENLLIKSEQSLTVNWEVLVAMIPTLIVALRTKSLSATVITGVICMAILRYFI